MKVTVEKITPDSAKTMLSHNSCNRPLRMSLVKRYAKDMTAGFWAVNGQSISFAKNGTLLDGQHRLHAVILSGAVIDTLVVRGLDNTVFDTIDGGAKRTTGDVLALCGAKNSNALSATLTLYAKWLATKHPYGGPEHMPTAKQARILLQETPGLEGSVTWAQSMRWCCRHLTAPLTAFSRFVFGVQGYTDEAAEFFNKLESGTALSKGSPILILRERLAENSATSAKARLTPTYRAALLFKAFRLYKDDAEVKTLRVRTEGPSAERNLFLV